MNSYTRLNTPVEFFEKIGNFSLCIKRDDKTFGSFGTKFRRLGGLLCHLKTKKIHSVFLSGSPHSNFVSSASYIFHSEGFHVSAAHISKDPKIRTANSILSNRFADKIYICRDQLDLEDCKADFQNAYPDGFVIPKFGLNVHCFESLSGLWGEINSLDNEFGYVFLDIGSGLTFLSALKHLSVNKKIFGVAIGNKKDKLEIELANLADEFGLDMTRYYEILIPAISPNFSSRNSKLESYIREVWASKKIPLEPIYSAKTLFTIIKYIEEKNLEGKGIYIHQGGLLSHLRYFSE